MDRKPEIPELAALAAVQPGLSTPMECLLFLVVMVIISAVGTLLSTGLTWLFPAHPAICRGLSQAGAAAAVPILFCRSAEQRPLRSLGFCRSHWLSKAVTGAFLGLAMMTAAAAGGLACGVLKLSPGRPAADLRSLVPGLGFFLLQGLSEEVLCRGYFLLSLLRKPENRSLALPVSALVFAGLHLLNPGIRFPGFCNLFLFGIFAGLYFLKSGSIWGIAAMHSLWNFSQGCIWGIPVSGTRTGPSLFSLEPVPGWELLTGGSFGLEGGLLCTAVLCLGIFLLIRNRSSAAAGTQLSPD